LEKILGGDGMWKRGYYGDGKVGGGGGSVL